MRLSSFWALLALRVANAALLQTSFNPDEYWQSLEVAHKLVFGYGHCTWEWVAGIRSVIHPALFVPLFAGLRLLGLDTTTSLIASAKLLQSIAAAATDKYVYLLAAKLHGKPTARWALACQLLSWFNAFCLPRTFSNCLEALCTVAALYYWPHLLEPRAPKKPSPNPGLAGRGHEPGPATSASSQEQQGLLQQVLQHDHHWHQQRRLQHGGHHQSRPLALAIAAVGVLLRPSSALFWALVGLYELLQARDPATFVFWECLPIGVTALGTGMLLDRSFYGRWVVVPWEFFKFNILQGGSALYGAHPWHWNFTQGLPTIAGPLLPLMLFGGCLPRYQNRSLALCATAVLVLYSLPAHKEFRILLPALHLLMPLCGAAMHHMQQQYKAGSGAKGIHSVAVPRQVRTPAGATGNERRQRGRGGSMLWWGALVLLLVNVPVAAYFSLFHQRGALAAMRQLEAAAMQLPAGRLAVLFLMPCHSTPLYSHLHHRAPLHFLDCSPPGYAAGVATANGAVGRPGDGWAPEGYSSETEYFMRQPLEYVEARFSGGGKLPYSHVLMFEGQAAVLASWMYARGCSLKDRLFNAHLSNGHDLQRVVWIWLCLPAQAS